MKILHKLGTPLIREVLGIGIVKLFAIPVTLGIAIMLARTGSPEINARRIIDEILDG